MEGYLNFTLAQSPMENWGDQNRTMCRYQAFRDDSGKYTMVHWQILALKLAFVICFEVSEKPAKSKYRRFYENEYVTKRKDFIVIFYFSMSFLAYVVVLIL